MTEQSGFDKRPPWRYIIADMVKAWESSREFIRLAVLALMIGLVVTCSKNSAGPDNSPPIVDSISVAPNFILPSGIVHLTAAARDPDNDSLTFKWSTYPHAAIFSNDTGRTTDMQVSERLESGMMMKIIVKASDGKSTTVKDRWITIDSGNTVSGSVFFQSSTIPATGMNVSIGLRSDTADTNGYYELKNVPNGSYDLVASKTGFDSVSAPIEVAGDLHHDIYTSSHDSTGYLTGWVATYDGKPLQMVRITITNPDGSNSGLTATTGSDGSYRIEAVPLGMRQIVVEDAGNPDYRVLTELYDFILPSPGLQYDIVGKIRRLLFASDGIASDSAWIFAPDGMWQPWQIDSTQNSFHFGFCVTGDMGKITMKNAVYVPPEASKVYWSFDIELTNASLEVGFNCDSVEVNQGKYWDGTRRLVIDEPIDLRDEFLFGHEITVKFFAWPEISGTCGTVDMRRFALFYYQ